MKKSTKIWLIIAALLLVIGLGLSVAALAAVDFDVSRLNTEGAYERRTYTFDAEQLKSAEIHSVSQDIRVVGSDEKAGTVEYYTGERIGYAVSFSEGKLTIRHFDERRWYEHIHLFFSSRDDTVTVYVPTDTVFALTCHSTSGNIEASGFTGNKLFLKNTSGSIRVSDITAAELEARSTSGSIEAARIRVTEGGAVLAAVSGSVVLEDAVCAQRLEASAISGRVGLTNSTCGDAILQTTSGALYFKNLRCDSLNAESVSGSIKGSLTGSASDYRFIASSTSGSVSIPPEQGGSHEVRLRTTSGSIDIKTES